MHCLVLSKHPLVVVVILVFQPQIHPSVKLERKYHKCRFNSAELYAGRKHQPLGLQNPTGVPN